MIGTPGIGKSVFAWWFIRELVALGFTVIYQKEKSARSYLCKDGRVLAGTHDAFDNLSEDANTWYVPVLAHHLTDLPIMPDGLKRALPHKHSSTPSCAVQAWINRLRAPPSHQHATLIVTVLCCTSSL